MCDMKSTELDKQLSIITSDLDKQLSIRISLNIPNDNYSQFYIDGIRGLLANFDEKYKYTLSLYKNTHQLEAKLREIGSFNDSNDFQKLDDGRAHTENLLEIKRQMDSIFSKYLPSISDGVSENTDGLDLELMDKITPLVPEGKEILLKNIVKELNGSAKGLSDFVIIFTKYRQAIINHNGIEYFQRKGCHFLRKI